MAKFLGRLAPEQLKDKQEAQQQLLSWKPQHDFLTCFDVDGHLLDNMTSKQMIVFQPNFMDIYGLREIETFYRLHAEAHNLWTENRGCDRHEAKNRTLLSLLNEDPALKPILEENTALREKMAAIQKSIQSYMDHISDTNGAFGYDSLWAYSRANTDDPNLAMLAMWSRCCDLMFPYVTIPMKPFPAVPATLEYLSDKADVLIVSKTPYDDICNWLETHDLIKFVTAVAGKEQGGKDEHICIAKGGTFENKKVVEEGSNYKTENVIMGGDGGGDLKAAKKNDAFFFPTPPGQEEAAWDVALDEVFKPLMAGTYQENEPAKLEAFKNAMLPQGCWMNAGYDHKAEYLKLQPKRQELYKQLKPGGKLVSL